MSDFLITLSTANMIKIADTIVNILFVLIGVGIVGFVLYIKVIRKHLPDKNGMDEAKPNDVKIDNSRLLLDIVENIEDGIIVTDKGTRYIAGIRCDGYSFFADDLDGKLRTMENYQSFIGALEGPVSFRSSSRVIDAEKPKEKYDKRIEELMAQYDDIENRVKFALTADEKIRLAKEKEYLGETIYHLGQQLELINIYSKKEVITDTYQCYFFEWKFKESDYRVKKTPEEIFAMAKSELNNRTLSYISMLSASHVYAKRLTQTDMLNLFRQQSRPYSSDVYSLKELDKTSWNTDIVSSDTYKEMAAEKVTELNDKSRDAAKDIFGIDVNDLDDESILIADDDDEDILLTPNKEEVNG